jgi:hypothetical protein
MIEELQNDLANLGIPGLGSIPGAGSETAPAVSAPAYMTALNALDALCEWRQTEVDLPLLKTKVLVKPIKGLEELNIKSLKASGETFIKAFDEILFAHTDFQGKIKFKDINDFMAHLGSADKTMLTYGLLFATYPDLGEREFECPYCNKKQIHNIRPDELLHKDSLPKKWDKKMLFTDFKETLVIAPGFEIEMGFQTEKDSLDVLSIKDDKELRQNLEDYNDLFETLSVFIMFIKSVTISNKDGVVIKLTKLKEEIYPFIMGLKNIVLLEKLIETISGYEGLAQYQPKFYASKMCKNVNCGKEFKWPVNPEIEFFRKASSFYAL